MVMLCVFLVSSDMNAFEERNVPLAARLLA